MSIINKKYLGSASMILGELFELTAAEKKQMKQMFSKISPAQLEKYRQEVQHDILAYISAKPLERLKRPEWNNTEYMLKLHYFSFLYLQRGYLFMRRLASMPNRNGLRRIPAFFAVMAESVCFKKFKDSIFNDELTYEDFHL